MGALIFICRLIPSLLRVPSLINQPGCLVLYPSLFVGPFSATNRNLWALHHRISEKLPTVVQVGGLRLFQRLESIAKFDLESLIYVPIFEICHIEC